MARKKLSLIPLAFIGVSLFLLVEVKGQIEFLLDPKDSPGNGVKLTDSGSAPSIVRTCKKLCVNGAWAMYTSPNYGRSNLSNVKVYPVVGDGSQSCTSSSVASILQTIYSVQRLADPTVPDKAVGFFPSKYFLSASDTEVKHEVPPSAPTDPTKVKSFVVLKAFTGGLKICETAAKCACLRPDMMGTYVVPDITKFPVGDPFKSMSTITKGCDLTCTDCSFPGPNDA